MSREAEELLSLLEKASEYKQSNKLEFWEPIEAQWRYLNETSKLKGIISGNQCGKTQTLAYEESCHLTGIYPTNWKGMRYNRPVDTIIASVNKDLTRDGIQKAMFGPIGQWGTGYIPKGTINFDNMIMEQGVTKGIGICYVKHVSGGWSSLTLKAYKSGREDFQSLTVDRFGFDEEPPWDIFEEAQQRVAVKKGVMTFAFTPLSGGTELITYLMDQPTFKLTRISQDECPWFTKEELDAKYRGMNPHQANARRHGIPAISGGQVFQYSPEEYTCDSFEIPNYWPRIGGLDIGINHPTAAVAVAIDPDNGCMYVYQEYGTTGEAPTKHAQTLKHWRIPFALSHDAYNRSSQTAKTTASLYHDEGMSVFNAGKDLWGHIGVIRSLINEGRLWIFRDKCPKLCGEMIAFRTKDNNPNQIVDKDDDYVAALRHATFHSKKAEIIGRSKMPKITIIEHTPFDKRLGV